MKNTGPTRRIVAAACVVGAAMMVASACGNASASGGGGGAVHLSKLTIVVGAAAGGSIDELARQIESGLQQRLHASVIVQDVAGANGTVANNQVVQQGSDCSTILSYFLQGMQYTFEQPGVPYHPSDFRALANVLTDYADIRVLRNSKYGSLQDLLAAAKANPGKISVSLQAVQSSNGAGMQALEKVAGVKFNLVPFGGSGSKARTALIGAHVDANASNVYNGQSIAQQSKVLAVQQPSNKWKQLTDNAPTMSSVLGKKVPDASSLYGLAVSAKCAKEHPATAKAIQKAIAATMKDPAYLAKYKATPGRVNLLTGSALQQAIKQSAQLTGTPMPSIPAFMG